MTKRLLVFLLLLSSLQASYGISCLTGWRYNRSITVTNSNASVYSNFQVKLVVNTQALVAAGKMQANGNDIRFTDGSCNNLHYWIDSNMNTTTTVIWVKVPSLPSSASTTIYMYYGNYCATAAQNGDSTFMFFDDFSAGSYNTGKWSAFQSTAGSASVTQTAGKIAITTTAATDNILRSVTSFTSPFILDTKVSGNSGSSPSLAILNSGTFAGVSMFTNTGTGNFNTNQASASGSSYTATNNASATARSNGFWSLSWPSTNSATATFPNGASQSILTTPALSANAHVAFGILNSGTGSLSADWLRVRKYAPLEPSTTLNTENAQGINITFTPAAICPGNSITINFTKNGVFFSPGNTFKIELSDSAGNFGSPTVLSTIIDTVLTTQNVELPKTTLPSSKYKIRVTSTNPAVTCYTSNASLIIYPKPSVSYTVSNDNQCFKNNRYNFTSTSTISSGTITSYIWNWDDGTKLDTITTGSTNHRFKYFYPYYYPKLTIISNNGCKDSSSIQINMKESPNIITEFNDTIQCFRGNFYTIRSLTSPSTGVITSLSFNFGDGSPTVSNLDSVTHKYSTPGTYFVRQINTHSNGCIDTNDLACLVNVHPIAKINTNDTDQCLIGNRFVFESQSTITNGLPIINYWNLSGGNTRDMQDSAQITYSTAANRQIQLISISDDGVDGCSDTTTQDILVNPMPKAIVQNVDDDQCFKYNNFKFIAKSTIAYGTLSHDWNFGDLSTLTAKDTALHTYSTDGAYSVKMTVTSNKGCIDTIRTPLNVRPTPVPSFTVNNKTQCFKYHEFKANSTSSITSGTYTKLWLLSDGADYTNVDSITHLFNVDGNYNLTLIVTSNYNCKDTISDSLFVLPMPVSDFTVNNADQCFEGNNFTFTDNSSFASGTITGNKWLYGDGNTASNASPVSHVYTAENAYKPGLIVYGDNGCFDTSFVDIKVYPHPGSDFLINDTGQCVNNNNFFFTNNTFISEGAFTNRWFYGDGSAFVDALNGSKKYTKDSTFIVRVISYSDRGCTDTAWKTVTVFPKAKTGFTINNAQQCLLGNAFSFVSTTTLKRGTYITNWQYGDGNVLNNAASANHSYFNVSPYNVKLISQTNEGCMDTLVKQVRTLPMPNADFTYNYNKRCLTGNDFQFSATSTVSNGTPMNHKWYFGDGDSTINSTFANNQYATEGLYTVRLITATNIGGCKDTMDKVMEVFPMPAASFIIDRDKQCFLGNNFIFGSTSTISTGTIDFTDWTFGDNTTATIASPSKSYTRVDSFKVKLVVTTNNGCIDSASRRVNVYPMPNAGFISNKKSSCFKKNSFNFTNKATIGNGGTIAQYQYYFDALNYPATDSSSVPSPLNYSYPASGFFQVMQKVTSDKGCWDTASLYITVNPNPELDFSVDSVCLKDSSIFINNTTIAAGGTITSWKWLFGDGKISTLQSPKHKYRNVGIYDVKLVANTNLNCLDTLVKPLIAKVNPNPKAGFYITKERSWENEVDIQYHDTSSGAVSWKWNFSTMGTSTDQNPKLYYIDTLTQPTSLIVTNIYGCRDTSFKVLFISPDVVYYLPTAFTPNDDNINETFKPIGLAYAVDYTFIVFNRWGDILFKTDNPQLGWDGKYQSELVEQGLYFYRLEFIGADELRHEEKGNVMILR